MCRCRFGHPLGAVVYVGNSADNTPHTTTLTAGRFFTRSTALILANVFDFAQQGALRIKWSMPMGPEMPWYAAEVTTVFVSLNCPTT